jgi:hypothetical protein
LKDLICCGRCKGWCAGSAGRWMCCTTSHDKDGDLGNMINHGCDVSERVRNLNELYLLTDKWQLVCVAKDGEINLPPPSILHQLYCTICLLLLILILCSPISCNEGKKPTESFQVTSAIAPFSVPECSHVSTFQRKLK